MEVKHRKDLSVHSWKRYRHRDISQIKRIVVHHFAGNITIEEAADLHVSKGWPGIGYWAVIDFDGSVHVVNQIDRVSYNVARNNTPTVGIALRGDWSLDLPPTDMLFSLSKLIDSVRYVVGPVPVQVHSDFVNTKCPGSRLREWIRMCYPNRQQMTSAKKPGFVKKIISFFQADKDHP